VRECRKAGRFPIVLSGNCNTAIGTVTGCGSRDTGIVWFDAHGEAMTPETTSSGFLDAMGISTLAGQCWSNLANTIPGFTRMPGKQIVLFGARDLEPSERTLLETIGVEQLQTREQLGEYLSAAGRDFGGVYLHVDLDVLDPTIATANQWTPPGGMSIEALIDAILEIREHLTISALGIGSYDPARDANGKALDAAMAVAETVLTAK
jgi:arginase